VIIEAWAARRPVVATTASGPRELITDSVDGVLTPIDDPASLAHAIRSVLDAPRYAAALAEAGRARYEAEFAEAPVVAQWRRFLASVEKP
jgi:glycosyltransferase involved in cell wall biosynthesis